MALPPLGCQVPSQNLQNHKTIERRGFVGVWQSQETAQETPV